MSVAVHAERVAGAQDSMFLVAGGAPAEVAKLANVFKTLSPRFETSDPPGALVGPLNWPTLVQVSAAIMETGCTWHPGPALSAWVADQQARRAALGLYDGTFSDGTDHAGQLRYLAEFEPDFTPYPWQAHGARVIAEFGGALINDAPRTGKTYTTLLGLAERVARGLPAFPAIIVTPTSVVDSWIKAAAVAIPGAKAIAWRGTPKKRQSLIGTADIYVTNYETMRIDSPTLAVAAKKPFTLYDTGVVSVISDEAHLIKNPGAQRTKSFHRLSERAAKADGAVVMLTGTPITHSPADLWPSLAAICPTAFPSSERWVRRYCQLLEGDYRDEVLGLEPAHEAEFRLSMLGQHRRVVREDVMGHLPPKTYSTRVVEMPAEWRKAYDAMEAEMLAELPDGSQMSAMGVLAQLVRLSQLSSAPAHVDVEVTDEIDEKTGMPKVHTHVTLLEPSWKVEALLEVLAERTTPGPARELPGALTDQTLVFAESRQLIDLAGAAATEAGYRVGYVVGGQKPTDRTATVDAFQSGELDVICATTSVGGVGLTLHAAGTLVFLQRPWSIVDSTQAEDRAEGDPNATRGTEIIDILTEDTIDDRRRAVLGDRAEALSELLQDRRIVEQLFGGDKAKRRRAKKKAESATPAPEAQPAPAAAPAAATAPIGEVTPPLSTEERLLRGIRNGNVMRDEHEHAVWFSPEGKFVPFHLTVAEQNGLAALITSGRVGFLAEAPGSARGLYIPREEPAA